MSNTIIKLECILSWLLSGAEIGVEAWGHRMAGKEFPTLKIGQINQLNSPPATRNPLSDWPSGRAGKPANDYVWALKDINLEVK